MIYFQSKWYITPIIHVNYSALPRRHSIYIWCFLQLILGFYFIFFLLSEGLTLLEGNHCLIGHSKILDKMWGSSDILMIPILVWEKVYDEHTLNAAGIIWVHLGLINRREEFPGAIWVEQKGLKGSRTDAPFLASLKSSTLPNDLAQSFSQTYMFSLIFEWVTHILSGSKFTKNKMLYRKKIASHLYSW